MGAILSIERKNANDDPAQEHRRNRKRRAGWRRQRRCAKLGLPVEQDLYFEVEKSLTAYADEARLLRRIKA
jgi:hypothetical protein